MLIVDLLGPAAVMAELGVQEFNLKLLPAPYERAQQSKNISKTVEYMQFLNSQLFVNHKPSISKNNLKLYFILTHHPLCNTVSVTCA